MSFAQFVKLMIFLLSQILRTENKIKTPLAGALKKDLVKNAVSNELLLQQAALGFDPSIITKLLPYVGQVIDLIITILNLLGIFKTKTQV
jgi:hypothetical protein